MKYKFNAERFCRVRARAARTVRNFDDEQNFLRVADELKRLRGEVGALKEAARVLVIGVDRGVIHVPCGHFYFGDHSDCDCCQQGSFVPAAVSFAKDIDALAALAGEEL